MILVESPGLFTTVQDLGREGHGPMGVSPSGAADPIALRLANRLAGNPEGAAGLEMTLLGGTFLFQTAGIAALGGSDFGASLDGSAVDPWSSFELRPGQRLKVGPTRSGARCYLAVAGGIIVTPFLNSASTHILSGLGGFEGRALKKGDSLAIGSAEGSFRAQRISPAALAALSPRKTLRVTPGPQAAWFSAESLASFYSSTYKVTEEANRMGLRLEGPALDGGVGGHMISEGVALGAIQIPSGGKPIILFVEQQTAGGYPKIANVISVDLASVGQLRPRDEVRFELVDMETARTLLRDREELMRSGGVIIE